MEKLIISPTSVTSGVRERVSYADLMRVFAMTAVIILHISGGWFNSAGAHTGYWWLFNVLDSLVRWCVPLFLMISGMFFLDPSKHLTLKNLYCKYVLRILVALVVWTIFYTFLLHWNGFSGLSAAWLLNCLKSALLGESFYHLWYLYTTIGLYLISPILRVFVRSAQKKDFLYFFLLCFLFGCLLRTFLTLRPSHTLQLYTDRLDVKLVLGYVGLYVGGYYLKTFPLSTLSRRIFYGLGIVGAAITICGTEFLSPQAGLGNVNLYSYCAPNVVFMAIAFFLLFQNHGLRLSQHPWVSKVGSLSFGVYLVHPFFLQVLAHFGYGPGSTALSPVLLIPLQFMFLLLCSLAASWCISKIPVLKRYLA
jgi:surface polysaccharide O-acyltransferase-like enzyme